MISIICPSNNPKILDKYLKSSLQKQSFQDYELIVVDAKEHGFTSAAQALNYGASLAQGDILVFCHHDIEFLKTDALSSILDYSHENDFGIAGVAGVSEADDLVHASVIQGPKRGLGGIDNQIVMPVAVIDECLMIVKRKQFLGFDDLGPTWHFYGVDYSYRCADSGKAVLLFPIPIYHLSPGWSMDASYFDTLRRIAKKYPERKLLRTCMLNFPNGKALEGAIRKKKFKMRVKKILHLR